MIRVTQYIRSTGMPVVHVQVSHSVDRHMLSLAIARAAIHAGATADDMDPDLLAETAAKVTRTGAEKALRIALAQHGYDDWAHHHEDDPDELTDAAEDRCREIFPEFWQDRT